jgi:hypothetical protein
LILRLLIGTGLLLMFVGFGAAGWQYWQSLPSSVASTEPAAAPALPAAEQRWLMSPTGGVVPQDETRAFLEQGRFVPSRTVEVIRQADLAALLEKGETLPAAEYHEVLADIRAPRVADGLCDVLTKTIASDCAVNSARVIEDSVDHSAGTAMFRLELVYRVKVDVTELPDLAAQVLRTDTVQLDLDAGVEGTESAGAALAAAVAAACVDDEGAKPFCRLMSLKLAWKPDSPISIQARIAWLEALPNGMYMAPPLEPAAGG